MLVILPIGCFNTANSIALRSEIPWQWQKDSTVLRIMTWNVHSFSNNLPDKGSKSAYRTSSDGILATVHNYNPDIICFQEFKNLENAKRRISIRKQLDSLGYPYFLCSNNRTRSSPNKTVVHVGEGVAIYSKRPLLDSARIKINYSEDSSTLIYADVLFNKKTVRIFTAHLRSLGLYTDTTEQNDEEDNIYEITYKRRKAVEYKIRETEVKHQEEVAVIRKAIDQSSNSIIYCGDLNTTPTSYNFRTLKGNNLQDAFLAKGSGIGNTFYELGPTLRIDVCFVDKAMKVLQCKREEKKFSDHYPVIADVSWK